MITLQEQFEKDFPDKSVREIIAYDKYKDTNFTNYDLDLRGYINLEELNLAGNLDNNKITSIKLPQSSKLRRLYLRGNNLTSVDFLNTIPNPKKLEALTISDNNIQPTDISIFGRFVNL